MQVLIVEDDSALGLFLQKGLTLEGHEVDWVGDGETGLEYVQERRPDLVVLDLSLPRKDGMQVLEEMQDLYRGTAVLVLTARSQVEERIRCLNLGADDCLLKPFSFHELTARCRALLRRRELFADPVLRHDEIELNRMDHKVRSSGRVVELTVKEFSLLEYLLQRKGRCCSRTELLREVWHMNPDAGTNIVDVYINYLRKKLTVGTNEVDPRCTAIETVRGEGYRVGSERKMTPRVAEYAASAVRIGA